MRGGPRPNSGRPKGATTAVTAIRRAEAKQAFREKVDAIKAEGELPLEVLLRIMRTSTDEETIIDCAKAAAPFIHPRLAQIESTNTHVVRHEDVLDMLEQGPVIEHQAKPNGIAH